MSTQHRDQISQMCLFCGLLTAAGFGLWLYGQSNSKPEFFLYGTITIGLASIIATVSMAGVIAAGADYMKTIADQQTAALERKRAVGSPTKDEPVSAPPSTPQYKGRTLGKPEL